MKLTIDHLFWLGVTIFLAIVVLGTASNPHVDLTPYLVFIFIVGFLLLQAHEKGELDIGLLAVNGLVVCLSFVAHGKGMFNYLFWGVLMLVTFSLPSIFFTRGLRQCSSIV